MSSEVARGHSISEGAPRDFHPQVATATVTYLPFSLSVQTALSSQEVPPPAIRAAQQLLAEAPLRTRRYHLGGDIRYCVRRGLGLIS